MGVCEYTYYHVEDGIWRISFMDNIQFEQQFLVQPRTRRRVSLMNKDDVVG